MRRSPPNAALAAKVVRRGGLRSGQDGMVLIIVLTCLALLAILIISFMSGATSELAASKQYSASAETQNLASSALNLAMGQVATGAKANENTVSWASQPGMIRNFNTSSTNTIALYKLYTSSRMIVTGADAAGFAVAAEAPPLDWDTKPALFTDLNQPTGAGTDLRFPIVDPRASAGLTKVEGFSYQPAVNGAVSALSSMDTAARLPMPVEWLYVLKNGSFVAATSTDGKTASVAGATKDNPIIGRVAFWTDDESCKVNVNTASEGSFWDTPSVSSPDDYKLDNFPPVQAEFQRYPGHPATVSLSSVFPWLTAANGGHSADAFYRMAPRIQQGGSLEGTRNPSQVGVNSFSQLISAMAIPLDSDRLFDSVDELSFDAARIPTQNITSDEIERRRFFLTTQSRSPELTLFNTPKVCIWPLATASSPSKRSAAEDLIAFAASNGSGNAVKEYFFTRSSPLSATVDYNDAARSGRNKELITYLSTLTGNAIPGFGSTTFNSKWGADQSQILLEVFDYIRGTTNLRNPINPAGAPYTGPVPNTSGFDSSTVYPTVLANGQRGFGRYLTVSEAAMLFGCEKDGSSTPSSTRSTIWPALILETMLTSPGSKLAWPNVCVKISGLSSFQWKYKKPGVGLVTESMWPADGNTKTLYAKCWPFNRSAGGGYETAFYPAGLLYVPENTVYTGLSSDDIQGNSVENEDPTFDFLGGTVTFTVALADNPTASPQTFTITFPPILGLRNPQDAGPDRNTIKKRVTPGGTFSADNFIQSKDVVKGMEVRNGDIRMIALKPNVLGGVASNAGNDFVPHPSYFDPAVPHAHLLRLWTPMYAGPGVPSNFGYYDPALTNYRGFSGNVGYRPKISSSNAKAENVLGKIGDWDTGMGSIPDGPFINKPDEGGDTYQVNNDPSQPWTLASYLSPTQASTSTTELYFSPSRQLASPVMFGSLPTGLLRNQPWQTLLFCPNPAAGFGINDHKGFASPPDYLFLDLFWMPVTEPYAISDPFATAGKINLNTQILPFTYITRETGLHALLKNERVTAIPDVSINSYKVWYPNTNPPALKTRFSIDIPETLKQFSQRFNNSKIFRSATQICEIFLVPEGQTEANVKAFWGSHHLTGDNLRERPYNAIYPRVTTQSNVYTVYVKAQSLKQGPGTLSGAPNSFTEGKDIVEGEFQASYTFERYIDPNARLTGADTDPLGSFYKLRVINQRNLSY